MIIDHIAAVAFFIFAAGVFVGLGVSLYDRAERRQAVVDVLTAAARCETAAKISTAKESKAHEHAQAARHAANDAKRFMRLAEGFHDCIKPSLPLLSQLQDAIALSEIHTVLASGRPIGRAITVDSVIRVSPIPPPGTVDMNPPTIDPQGRTGEMCRE